MSKSKVEKEIISRKYNRHFSEAFKREKVKEIEKGVLSMAALCRLHTISRTTVYKWIYLYSGIEKGTKTVVQMESEQHKTLYLQQRLAELERIIGQKQMEIDYLNKAMEIAGEELGYDLKKSKDYKKGLIHHSDRGMQYVSDDYTNLLDDYGIAISMCTDVLENAHSERANGTIKNEYLNRWSIRDFEDLKIKVKQAVANYNDRLHWSIKATPNNYEIALQEIPMEKRAAESNPHMGNEP